MAEHRTTMAEQEIQLVVVVAAAAAAAEPAADTGLMIVPTGRRLSVTVSVTAVVAHKFAAG